MSRSFLDCALPCLRLEAPKKSSIVACCVEIEMTGGCVSITSTSLSSRSHYMIITY